METDRMTDKPMTAEQLACPSGFMVHICAWCHKFLGYVPAADIQYTSAFSHGICCDCCAKHYGNEPWYKKEMGEK